jgi:hypothetical protein
VRGINLGLAQTGWSVDDDATNLAMAKAHSVAFFDAVPSKYESGAFETAVSAWSSVGIHVRSTQGFFFNQNVAVCSCRDHYQDLLRVFKLAIGDAALAKAQYMILGAPSSRAAACDPTSFLRAVDCLGELSTGFGISLLIENLPAAFSELPMASLKDISRMPRWLSAEKNFGVCLDVGNLVSCLSGKESLLGDRDLEELEAISHLQVNLDFLNLESRVQLEELLMLLPKRFLEQTLGSVSLEFSLGNIQWSLISN